MYICIHFGFYYNVYIYIYNSRYPIHIKTIPMTCQEKFNLTAKLVAAMERCSDLEERCQVLVAKKILGSCLVGKAPWGVGI